MDEQSHFGHFVVTVPVELRNIQKEAEKMARIYRFESYKHLRD